MAIPKIFQSSVDPAKLSLTLKGLVPLALMVVKMVSGTEITQSGVEDLIDAGILVFTAVITFIGLVRKIKPAN